MPPKRGSRSSRPPPRRHGSVATHTAVSTMGLKKALRAGKTALGPLKEFRDQLGLMYGYGHRPGSTEGVLVTESNTAYQILKRLLAFVDDEKRKLEG